jgi:hypothetical protein
MPTHFEALILPLVALVYGFSVDFADLLDEHGLKWFKRADIAFGIIWGVAGSIMMFLYPPISIYVVGLLLYWIAVKKIDYLNHQIAAAIILISALIQIERGLFSIEWTIICFVIHFGLAKIRPFAKDKKWESFFLLIRKHIPMIILFLFTGDWTFLLVHIISFLGFVISDKWFVWFQRNESLFFKKLGFVIYTR